MTKKSPPRSTVMRLVWITARPLNFSSSEVAVATHSREVDGFPSIMALASSVTA